MLNHKTYLGDSVYASFDGYNIILSLDNGFGNYNHITLEPIIVEAFLRFKERVDNEYRKDISDNP